MTSCHGESHGDSLSELPYVAKDTAEHVFSQSILGMEEAWSRRLARKERNSTEGRTTTFLSMI